MWNLRKTLVVGSPSTCLDAADRSNVLRHVPVAHIMADEDWSSLAPGPNEGWGDAPGTTEGWGDGESSVPLAGWGDVPSAPARPRPPPKERGPPPRLIDDEAAAKEVDKLCATVLAGKKKLSDMRLRMDGIYEKQLVIQNEIDQIMPALQELRAAKSQAMGQLAGARLPAVWMEKAKELNNRRRALPGGCTSVAQVKARLKETEHSISHGSLTLKQEKAALEHLRELKKATSVVAAYEADQAMLDQVDPLLKPPHSHLAPTSPPPEPTPLPPEPTRPPTRPHLTPS